jgi:hypothetical protein
MQARSAYNDEAFTLVIKPGPFGIYWPVICTYEVINKTNGQTVRLNAKEKSHMLACIAAWQRHGRPISELKRTGFFADVCQSVAARGGMLWKFQFQQNSPENWIAGYLNQ